MISFRSIRKLKHCAVIRIASTLSYRNYLSSLAVHNNNEYFAHRVNLTNGLAAKRHAPDGATVISGPFGFDAFGLELDLGAAYLDCPLAADLVLRGTR